MKIKTIIISALLAGSMQHAWGMDKNDNETIAEQVRQQNVTIACLLSRINTLEVIVAEQAKKLNGLHNTQQAMKQDVDALGRKAAHINWNKNQDKDGPHQANTDHAWNN